MIHPTVRMAAQGLSQLDLWHSVSGERPVLPEFRSDPPSGWGGQLTLNNPDKPLSALPAADPVHRRGQRGHSVLAAPQLWVLRPAPRATTGQQVRPEAAVKVCWVLRPAGQQVRMQQRTARAQPATPSTLRRTVHTAGHYVRPNWSIRKQQRRQGAASNALSPAMAMML